MLRQVSTLLHKRIILGGKGGGDKTDMSTPLDKRIIPKSQDKILSNLIKWQEKELVPQSVSLEKSHPKVTMTEKYTHAKSFPTIKITFTCIEITSDICL